MTSTKSAATTLCGLLSLRRAVLTLQWAMLLWAVFLFLTAWFTDRVLQDRLDHFGRETDEGKDLLEWGKVAQGYTLAIASVLLLLHWVGICAVSNHYERLYKTYAVVYCMYQVASWAEWAYYNARDMLAGEQQPAQESVAGPGFDAIYPAWKTFDALYTVYVLRVFWRYVPVLRAETARAKIDRGPSRPSAASTANEHSECF
ncbi:hypothetical protein RI367_006071 [Sorochytrium milnesiophthora]